MKFKSMLRKEYIKFWWIDNHIFATPYNIKKDGFQTTNICKAIENLVTIKIKILAHKVCYHNSTEWNR